MFEIFTKQLLRPAHVSRFTNFRRCVPWVINLASIPGQRKPDNKQGGPA